MIDPQIALGVRPMEHEDRSLRMGRLMSLADLIQKRQRSQSVRKALMGVDLLDPTQQADAVRRVMGIDPETGIKLSQSASAIQSHQAAAGASKKLEEHRAAEETRAAAAEAAKWLNAAHDDPSYYAALNRLDPESRNEAVQAYPHFSTNGIRHLIQTLGTHERAAERQAEENEAGQAAGRAETARSHRAGEAGDAATRAETARSHRAGEQHDRATEKAAQDRIAVARARMGRLSGLAPEVQKRILSDYAAINGQLARGEITQDEADAAKDLAERRVGVDIQQPSDPLGAGAVPPRFDWKQKP